MPPGIAIVVQGVVFHNISGVIHRIGIVFSVRRSERGRLETEDADPEWPLWRAEYSNEKLGHYSRGGLKERPCLLNCPPYGASSDEEEPHATTLDYVVAAAGG